MGDKKIYVIAKIFDKQGCIAYSCKTPNEARCLPFSSRIIRNENRTGPNQLGKALHSRIYHKIR